MSGPATKLRPWQLAPTPDDVQGVANFYDWITTSLNALIGQQVPPSLGLPGLNPPTVDPTSSILTSAGSRMSSLTTNFGFQALSTTSIGIYWDGTNSSTILRIYRDDGTIAGPFPGHQVITGLTASTTYYFYPFFNEAMQLVQFVSQSGAVGTPPIAYTTAAIAVAQQQILRGHIPLAASLAIGGVATPAGGSGVVTNAGGGGGSVGIYLGGKLTR
jgi:hypothetical protein